ncbi:hypothetical protein [Halomonas faecis]|uniref:hypothetical protein n=1 Tax=Halomonas faecis TaxID=1562110 RepID=UPI0013D3D385|nr:hypothetical protein [Halomonas faecis]
MNFDFIISIDENIHDPLMMGEVDIVREILDIAEQVTTAGRKVVVQRQYTNAAPDTIETFTKPEQVQAWRERLNKTQGMLGRESIS